MEWWKELQEKQKQKELVRKVKEKLKTCSSFELNYCELIQLYLEQQTEIKCVSNYREKYPSPNGTGYACICPVPLQDQFNAEQWAMDMSLKCFDDFFEDHTCDEDCDLIAMKKAYLKKL